MVDPYLPMASPADDVSLILHGFGPNNDMLLEDYPGYFDYRGLPSLTPRDTVISTVHINSRNYVNTVSAIVRSRCNWVHCSHDYAEPVISLGGFPIHKVILFNKPQYRNVHAEKKLYVNLHGLMGIPSLSSAVYKKYTNRKLTDEERAKNILLNVTKHPDKPLLTTLVDRAIELSKAGYRIFVKGYGYDELPDHYKRLLGRKNIYYPSEAFGPTGAPLVQDWCDTVLGVRCSAVVEALYYDNLPIVVDHNPGRGRGILRGYKTVGHYCPFVPSRHFEYLAGHSRRRAGTIRRLKRFWLGRKTPSIKKVRDFIYG